MTHTEGIGLILSAELLQSIASGILFLLLAGWISYFWRRSQRALLWRNGVEEWSTLGPLRATGSGWKVSAPRGWAIVRSGLAGTHTLVLEQDGARHHLEGIASVMQLRQLICSSLAD